MDVLIVDDSAAIRKILRRVLQQAEIPLGQVYEAGDGVEAIESLKKVKVQLILSDINMPNKDGLQLLGEVKSNPEWKDVPVVMDYHGRQPGKGAGSDPTGRGGLCPEALHRRADQRKTDRDHLTDRNKT